MRPLLPCFLLLAAGLLSAPLLRAESDATYVPPSGETAPVAPPLKKGSPLDHLANDPKIETPVIGYKEGHTTGNDFYYAHRGIDDMGGQGWGWVKENGQPWTKGQWIALQETPGLAVAPFRKLTKHDNDADWEYKFWGHFAQYMAYDPHLDELLPVFVLQGYEVIGPENPLNLKIGSPDRVTHRPSGASSRDNRPIQTDPGVD